MLRCGGPICARAGLGQGQTKPRTPRTSSDDRCTPIADEKINQINTVAMCQLQTLPAQPEVLGWPIRHTTAPHIYDYEPVNAEEMPV